MPDFSFMGNPVVPGQPQQMNIGYQPPQVMPQQQMYPMYAPQPVAPQPQQQLPVLTTGNSFGFTVVPDEPEDPKGMLLPVPMDDELPAPTKKRGRPKKEKNIVKVDNDGQDIEDVSALYTYAHTTMMLHETVGQIDMVASELKSELDDIRLSRTARNKYNTMVGLSTALGKLLETKVSAISQINSSISKANDLDYKREKDRKSLEVNQVMDDKRIMDMYQSFVSNPMGLDNNVSVLGPTAMQTSIAGSNIIRADVPGSSAAQNGGVDPGYTSYINNMTPEQNAMFYESNPNVKNCVVYDAATGMKQFQMMDLSTGQVVPNLAPLDNRFMEDTYIDLKTKTASNNNLHQTYPVVVINENVANQY